MTVWSAVLDQLPAVPTRNMAVHVSPAAERALRDGHPWVFADSLRDISFSGAPGTIAVIFDRKDRFLAAGFYDPASEIRIKVLQHTKGTRVSRPLFAEKLAAAVALREPLQVSEPTNGYRLVYGEGDGLPGLIVDRYAQTWVVKLYTAAWLPHLRDVLTALIAVQPCERIALRLSRNLAATDSPLQDGITVYGDAPTAPVVFQENGLTFAADIVHGHKTGFFFDQRENRERVRALAQAADVLDVFAYTGGFSVYAAAGGARSVLSMDISEPALEAARHNFALNADNESVAQAQQRVLVADAFEGMRRLQSQNKRYDLVVIDPPSFAKSQSEVDGALRSYRALARLGVSLVRPGGHLVMASCSSRVTADVFFSTVEAVAGNRLIVEAKTGHALDHPVRFPEGAYLKCLFGRVTS